jgi:hypothetical protein
MNKKRATFLGEKLHAYMLFRAAFEETNDAWSPEFFRDALLIGTTRFFGITFEGLELTDDEQNPEAFIAFQVKGGLLNSKERKTSLRTQPGGDQRLPGSSRRSM